MNPSTDCASSKKWSLAMRSIAPTVGFILFASLPGDANGQAAKPSHAPAASASHSSSSTAPASASVAIKVSNKPLLGADGRPLRWRVQPFLAVKAAAESGNGAATDELGDRLGNAPKEQFAWYLKSAKVGYLPGMLDTANAFQKGVGTDVDATQAAAWLEEAKSQLADAWNAHDQHVDTQLFSGYMKGYGGLPQDPAEGKKWLDHAVEYGAPEALLMVAGYSQGGYVVKQDGKDFVVVPQQPDQEQLFALYEKVAEAGDPEAQAQYCYMLKNSGADPATYLPWMQKAAEQGFDEGGYGELLYSTSLPGQTPDYKQAIQWFKKSADRGELAGFTGLADAHCDGKGFPKSGPAALALLQQAISVLPPSASYNAMISIGRMYALGACVPKSTQLSLHWYNQAIQKGAAASDISPLWISASNGGALAGAYNFSPDWYGKNPEVGLALLKEIADGIPQYKPDQIARFKLQAEVALGDAYSGGHGPKQDYAQATTWYEKAAADGSAEAMTHLGVIYQAGYGTPQDYSKAVDWYRQAADKGFAWGQFNLASMYANGFGVKQDDSQAIALFEKAADAGLPDAMNRLGVIYESGSGVKQDYAQALAWYTKGANRQFAWSEFNIAGLYRAGHGVPTDPKTAMEWEQKAAAHGLPDAINAIGNMYLSGEGVQADPTQAAQWYRKAADAGSAWGQQNLATLYASGKGVQQDYAQAAKYHELAAAQGLADAQNSLGDLFRDGNGVPRDIDKARFWYEKAAAQNNAAAEASLGDIYGMGAGVQQNDATAAQWYQKAASGGNARGEFAYGFLLEHGQSVQENDQQAANLYAAAANQGNAAAANNLGMMYEQGRGVGKDEQRALQLFQFAASHGDSGAAQNAQQLNAILQQEAAIEQARQQQEQAQQEEQDRQDKIAELQSDIEEQNSEAEQWDSQAEEASDSSANCSNTGTFASLCNSVSNTIGTLGAAKARQNAAKARAQAQADQEEIERLENMPVQHVNIDTSYAGALNQQTQLHPTPTIQDTLAQQQAQIFATAQAVQQQKLEQQEAALAAQRARLAQQSQNNSSSTGSSPHRSSTSSTGGSSTSGGSYVSGTSSSSTSSSLYPNTGSGTSSSNPGSSSTSTGGTSSGGSASSSSGGACPAVALNSNAGGGDMTWSTWVFIGNSGVAFSVSRVNSNTLTWRFFNGGPMKITTMNFNYTYIDADTGQSTTQSDLLPFTLNPGGIFGGWAAYTANTKGGVSISITQMNCQ